MTLAVLERLYDEGLLSEPAFAKARELHRSATFPWRWLDRVLLGTSVAMLLAGAIFLVAFNWHAIPKVGKLGLVEAALVACLGVAGWRGLDSRVGNAAVIAGSVFVGIFLAVYGQIYQTGADPWELFAGWAGLIVGFAALARSQTLWMIWALLVNVAVILYWKQVLVYAPDPPIDIWLTTVLGGVNAAMLAARECVWRRWRPAWLRYRWSRWVLAVASLGWLTGGTWLLAFYKLDRAVARAFRSSVPELFQSEVILAGSSNLLAWVLGSIAVYRHFRRTEFEFGVLVSWGVSCGMVGLIWSHVVIFDLAGGQDVAAYLAFGVAGLLISTGLAVWFRRLWTNVRDVGESRSGGGSDE